jgi:hypothetical protein
VTANLRLLVSTYKSLLLVEADTAGRGVLVTPIDQDKGIYYGLTAYRTGVLVAARNLDTARRQTNPAYPANAIYFYEPRLATVVPFLTDPLLTDLHQIRRYGELLFVVLGTGSMIAIFDLRNRHLVTRLKLAPHIPAHLRHHGGAHPDDPYHFNSLWTNGARLLVLAHNWDRGSFILDFHLSLGPPISINLIGVHERLGHASHDVVAADGRLMVLDGQGGQVIGHGTDPLLHDIEPLHGAPFPRGLSITRDHIAIGYGSWTAEPFTRLRSPSRLRILDRATWEIIMDGEIGLHGNPTDVLALSDADVSDAVRT